MKIIQKYETCAHLILSNPDFVIHVNNFPVTGSQRIDLEVETDADRGPQTDPSTGPHTFDRQALRNT